MGEIEEFKLFLWQKNPGNPHPTTSTTINLSGDKGGGVAWILFHIASFASANYLNEKYIPLPRFLGGFIVKIAIILSLSGSFGEFNIPPNFK